MGDRTTAIRFFNQGVETINDKSKPSNPTTAFQLFASACEMDPLWAHGWFQYAANIGGLSENPDFPVEHRRNWLRAAVSAYRRALQQEQPDKEELVKCYSDMGWRLFTLGYFDEADEVLRKAIELDPACHHAWVNLAQVHGLRSQNEEAVRCARRAYDIKPDELVNRAALSFALLFNRNFKEGFRHFECRFEWRLHQYLAYPYPKWEGEDDKVVFLVADQGLGDTLSFARFVEMAAKKAKYLHVYIQPELMRLFMHAFIGIKNLNFLPQGSTFPQADVWTTFVSLPFALGLSDEQIRRTKQITPPIFHLPNTWMYPDQKLHIGVAWKGSKLNDIDSHRTIPVQHFLELYRVPGIQLYSLQVGEGENDANLIGAGAMIKPLSPYIRDVCDTVALLQNLDLVIGCESALGHICSMVGKEFWMPYAYMAPDYRVGHDGKDVIWAPKHRIYKQGEDCRWEPVFENMIGDLEMRLEARKRKRA
jgi:tetratricopeptide (TPR) repeat protein